MGAQADSGRQAFAVWCPTVADDLFRYGGQRGGKVSVDIINLIDRKGIS
jgi:hypothetical protein